MRVRLIVISPISREHARFVPTYTILDLIHERPCLALKFHNLSVRDFA